MFECHNDDVISIAEYDAEKLCADLRICIYHQDGTNRWRLQSLGDQVFDPARTYPVPGYLDMMVDNGGRKHQLNVSSLRTWSNIVESHHRLMRLGLARFFGMPGTPVRMFHFLPGAYTIEIIGTEPHEHTHSGKHAAVSALALAQSDNSD